VDQYLNRIELLDCSGKISHTLVLALDGMVEIHFAGGAVARVDPRRRAVLSRGMDVERTLMDRAAELAGS